MPETVNYDLHQPVHGAQGPRWDEISLQNKLEPKPPALHATGRGPDCGFVGRISHGTREVVVHRLATIAALTVEKAPTKTLTIAKRIEEARIQKEELTARVVDEAGVVKLTRPSGRGVKPRRQPPDIFQASVADSSPKYVESHLPNGAWKRVSSSDEPTVKWYGGTKPVDEPNLWFTKHVDSVGPDSKIEKESELPQIGTIAIKGQAARVNVEYYLRRAVRRHGKDYVKAALMLADIYQQPGMPETMKKSIKRELLLVCTLAGRPEMSQGTMEGLLNPEGDEADEVTGHKAVETSFPAHGDGEIFDFMSKNATAGNKRGYVSSKVKRLACETMAALGDDTTMKQYENVALEGPEEVAVNSTRKFIPEIAEVAGVVVEKVVPITDPLFPELFQLSYRWIYDSGASKPFLVKEGRDRIPRICETSASHYHRHCERPSSGKPGHRHNY